MQKHNHLLITLCASVFICQNSARAGIYYLPHYQGGNIGRTQTGGRENVKVSCEARGGTEKKDNQICNGTFSVGNKTCYKSCVCKDGYKMSGGLCVEKGCRDYNASYLTARDDTQSCVEVNPRNGLSCYECTPCDTNAYKYACTGDGYEQVQSGYACNNLYESCSCSSGYTWNGTKCNKKCETVRRTRTYRNCYCQITYSNTYNLVCATEDYYPDTGEIYFLEKGIWWQLGDVLEDCEGQLPFKEGKTVNANYERCN